MWRFCECTYSNRRRRTKNVCRRDTRELSDYNINLDFAIGWDELNEFEGKETIGQCTVLGGKPVRIIIDQETWEQSDEITRLALMTHELVHCEFLYGHIKSTVNPKEQLMATRINYAEDCINKYDVTTCINNTVELYKQNLINDLGESESKDGHKHHNCNHDH